jgi:hypothetical protein
VDVIELAEDMKIYQDFVRNSLYEELQELVKRVEKLETEQETK